MCLEIVASLQRVAFGEREELIIVVANICGLIREGGLCWEWSLRETTVYTSWYQWYLAVCLFPSVQVYCYNMQKSHPREYITLPAGETENYSEVYHHRLEHWKSIVNGNVVLDRCENLSMQSLHLSASNMYGRYFSLRVWRYIKRAVEDIPVHI